MVSHWFDQSGLDEQRKLADRGAGGRLSDSQTDARCSNRRCQPDQSPRADAGSSSQLFPRASGPAVHGDGVDALSKPDRLADANYIERRLAVEIERDVG